MKHIIIHNPVNLSGIISTTTRGEVSFSKNEEVKLVDAAGQDLAYAEVLDVWLGPLGHVPALLLEMSSDPLQRVFTGLHTHLALHRKPDQEGTPMETIVTVLVLRVKESTIIRPSAAQIKDIQA